MIESDVYLNPSSHIELRLLLAIQLGVNFKFSTHLAHRKDIDRALLVIFGYCL